MKLRAPGGVLSGQIAAGGYVRHAIPPASPPINLPTHVAALMVHSAAAPG